MQSRDLIAQTIVSIKSQPTRASLIILAMSIGIASVVFMTALGESARNFVIAEFQSLGTNLVIILPGRNETTGGQPPLFGATPRDLTLADANALLSIHQVAAIAPVNIGAAPVSTRGLERETTILGSTADFRRVRHLKMAQGQFLPAMESDKSLPVCVIGQTIKDKMFNRSQALGQWLRINDRRFRVIGVLSSEGQSIGVNFDEIVIIPIASAQALFNTHSLFRILLEIKSKQAMNFVIEQIKSTIKTRHENEDDITVITQDSVVSTFDDILQTLTLTVASIASISLAVAGILVMNVMLVSVTQRTSEIGLLKALGASARQIQRLFLMEAAILSLAGAIMGLILGQLGIIILRTVYPEFPIQLPVWALAAAVVVSLSTGLIFGVLPARKAAQLDPVQALAKRT